MPSVDQRPLALERELSLLPWAMAKMLPWFGHSRVALLAPSGEASLEQPSLGGSADPT